MVPLGFSTSKEIKIQRSETKKRDTWDGPQFGELQQFRSLEHFYLL